MSENGAVQTGQANVIPVVTPSMADVEGKLSIRGVLCMQSSLSLKETLDRQHQGKQMRTSGAIKVALKGAEYILKNILSLSIGFLFIRCFWTGESVWRMTGLSSHHLCTLLK